MDDRELLGAAEHVGGTELEWLSALACAAVPLLGARAGVYAYGYRIAASGTIVLTGMAACGAASDYWDELAAWGDANSASIARLYKTQVMTLGQALARGPALGAALTDPSARFRAHGVRDLLVVMGQDVVGGGVILTAPSSDVVELPPAARAGLARSAGELALAQRRRVLASQPPPRLSERERELAELLATGASDKQLAAALGISLASVATHAARLRRKLGCSPGEELLALGRARADAGFRRLLGQRLTPAEHAVASALVAGFSHAAIARARGSSARTVASQVAAVFGKLGVCGRRELAARWFGAPARA